MIMHLNSLSYYCIYEVHSDINKLQVFFIYYYLKWFCTIKIFDHFGGKRLMLSCDVTSL